LGPVGGLSWLLKPGHFRQFYKDPSSRDKIRVVVVAAVVVPVVVPAARGIAAV